MKTSFVFLSLQLMLILFLSSCSLNVDSSQYTAEVVLIGDNGTISPKGVMHVTLDSVVSPEVSPLAGYAFKQWNVSGNIEVIGSLTNPQSALRVKGDGTVTAMFEKERPILTIKESDCGTITKSPDSTSYPYDTKVTLTATPNIGYKFTGWSGDLTGMTNPVTVSVTNNKTIIATFAPIPGVPGVVYVRKEATGLNDGSSWVNAYTDLNTTVSNAPSDAVIWVKGGNYTLASTLILKAHTKIYGGFSGFEETHLDANNRHFYNNFSILKGTNASVIMKLSNGRDTIGGFVFDSAAINAIYIESSDNCIEDCVIKNTGSSSQSNAVKLLPQPGMSINSNVIQRSVFHSNTGTNTNAGKAVNIAMDAFGTLIVNSVFYKNGGPAINNSNTTMDDASKTSIISCTIVDNGSDSWLSPGGIKNSSGLTNIQGSILWHNKSGVTGTQIDVADWVEDCDVQDNTGAGVKTKKRWQSDNLMDDPILNSMSILTDSAWFAPSSSHQFLPGANLHKANFLLGPSIDIRKYSRKDSNTFNMGAYEQ